MIWGRCSSPPISSNRNGGGVEHDDPGSLADNCLPFRNRRLEFRHVIRLGRLDGDWVIRCQTKALIFPKVASGTTGRRKYAHHFLGGPVQTPRGREPDEVGLCGCGVGARPPLWCEWVWGKAEFLGCRSSLRPAVRAWSCARATRGGQSKPRPRRCGGQTI